MDHCLDAAERRRRDRTAARAMSGEVQPNVARPVRPWLLLAWACAGVLLAAADLTALSTLIPPITIDLEVPLPGGLRDVAWVVTAYLIGNIVALPVSGRLADRFNRQRVFVGCLVVFALGAVGSALAPTLWLLIAARAVQAIGAGAMVPITMALATDVLPRQRWALAFGVIGAVDTAGWALGPLWGAMFVRWLDWRWHFWANVPLALLVALGAGRGLRGLTGQRDHRPMDWWGAALLTLGLLALNIGLGRLGGSAASGISFDAQPTGVPWGAAVPWLVGGVLLLAVFAAWQLRSHVPLINLRYFGRLPVAAAAAINVVFGALLITVTVNVPLFVNATTGSAVTSPDALVRDAALRSGLMLMALTSLMACGAPLGGVLAERWGTRWVVLVGALCATAGFWLMRTWQPNTATVAMVGHLALVGVGFGLILAPPAAVIVAAAPPDERGLASSVVLLLRMSGMSVGLGALTAWSLQRFDTLSRAEQLATLTGERIEAITVQVLTATFAATAALAVVAVVLAVLQPRRAAYDHAASA